MSDDKMTTDVLLARLQQGVDRAAAVCRSAAKGNLEERLLHIDESLPGLAALQHDINQMLDLTDAFVRESGAAMTCASQGLFHRRVLEPGLHGSFLRGAQTINTVFDVMRRDRAALTAAAEASRRKMADESRRAAALNGAMAAAEAASDEQGLLSTAAEALGEAVGVRAARYFTLEDGAPRDAEGMALRVPQAILSRAAQAPGVLVGDWAQLGPREGVIVISAFNGGSCQALVALSGTADIELTPGLRETLGSVGQIIGTGLQRIAHQRRQELLSSFMQGAGTALMLVDNQGLISYQNPALEALFAQYSGVVGALAGVRVGEPLQPLLVALGAWPLPAAGSEVRIANLVFGLNLVQLRDAQGLPIGEAIEWSDNSAREAYTQEVNQLVAALGDGRLDHRGAPERLGPQYGPMMAQLNGVAEVLAEPIAAATQTIAAVAEGRQVAVDPTSYMGEFRRLWDSIDRLVATNSEIAAKAHLVASGDLTVKMEPRCDEDELLSALDQMISRLGTAMGEVRGAGQRINSGARRVSTSSSELAENAASAASSLEQISASMEQISVQTQDNARRAGRAMEVADANRNDARDGQARMDEMVAAMAGIAESSQSISNIIRVIDEIAFQTNLLALNAAVEAARAGAHGRGFAVVAEEVRNLAARSAKAARETTELIESAGARVQNGLEVATTTAELFEGIQKGVAEAGDLVGEIAVASREQADGIAQITEGVAHLDAVTQQNTASSETMASAAGELSGLAGQLGRLLERFKVEAPVAAQQPTAMSPQMLELFRQFASQHALNGTHFMA